MHGRCQLAPAAAALLCLALAALGCATGQGRAAQVELSVFAASSLKEAFVDLEREFEAAHPGVDVRCTFAGSQVLRLQIEQGARADVFASANEAHMQALVDADLMANVQVFAANALVVAVPAANPSIASFDQLPQARRVVIGSDNVPVGAYARQVLARAEASLGAAFAHQVRRHVVSEESNVRLVRAKVELGEADAAFVYATDVAGSSRVRALPIPEHLNVRARYPVGVSTHASHAALARQLVAHLRSDQGQRTLAGHGFETAGL